MPAPWCAKRRNLDRSSKKDGWQQGFGTGRLKFEYQSEHFFGIEKEIMTRVRKRLVQLSFKHLPVVIPGHHTTSSLVLSGGQDRVPYPLWALSHCIIANLQWWQPCTAMPLQCYIYMISVAVISCYCLNDIRVYMYVPLNFEDTGCWPKNKKSS